MYILKSFPRLTIVSGVCTAVLTLCFAISPLPASAQERESDWTFRVGGGVLYAPMYPGSDDYALFAAPYLYVGYRDLFEASVQDGARYNVIRGEHLTMGPIARLDFGRREDGDNFFRVAGKRTKALQGMGDIDTTVELGGFVEYELEPFTASVELRQAVSGHDGLVGNAGIEFAAQFNPFGGVLILLVEPNLRFGNGTFSQSYFGVTTQQALNTGYTPYKPSGGIHSYGVTSTLILPLSERFFFAALAGYNSISGDAENSPLVRGVGSTDQFSVGLFAAIQFGG